MGSDISSSKAFSVSLIQIMEGFMEKILKRDKAKVSINYNLLLIFLIIFATSLSDGISSIVIPKILANNPKAVALVGSLVGIQSFIGVIIFLPQASFIRKFGEKACIRIGLFINLIVYAIYLVVTPGAIALGKFTEGFGDRLLNSTVSKLIYDETDNKNNRGKVRAMMDGVGNLSLIIGPAIAALLITYSVKLPIILALVLMAIVFVLSNKIELSQNADAQEADHKESFLDHYKVHLNKYFMNKYVVLLTLPSILLSTLSVFYGIILNAYLLQSGLLTIIEIGILWSLISALSILLQIPSGYLADKSKNIAFLLSFAFFIAGFYGLLTVDHSKYLLFISVLLIYTAGQFYTTSMSAMFGDVTTQKNRLSESESYRMFRSFGEGILVLLVSAVFAFNPLMSILIVGSLACLGVVITYLIGLKFYSKNT